MLSKVRISIIFFCGFSLGESNKESFWIFGFKCFSIGVDNNVFIDFFIFNCYILIMVNGGCLFKMKWKLFFFIEMIFIVNFMFNRKNRNNFGVLR